MFDLLVSDIALEPSVAAISEVKVDMWSGCVMRHFSVYVSGPRVASQLL